MTILKHTLFFFLLAAQICFGQWYPQNSATTQHLNKVQFIDANTGWAVGDSGTILYTTNSGVDWVQQASGINLNLVDISFVDVNTGWVVGENLILKTTNGGLSWIQQIQDSLSFNAVCFIEENIGWVVGDGMLKTTDGGNSWISKTGSGEDIQFLDPFTGYLAAHGIFKSTDGGDNWVQQMGGGMTGPGFFVISFSDTENGFAIIDPHWFFVYLYHTTNGGVNWLMTTELPNGCTDVYSINSNIVYVVGYYILKSSDAGATWDEQLSEIDKLFRGVHFVNENIGWVVGDSGTVLHTTNGGVTFIDNEPTQPTEFILSQNFPNPFNPSTTISWQSPVGSHQTIKVFDALGNEIATLVDEYKPAGKYEVEFNVSRLASGIYFYQLKAGEYVAVKKMILIK